VQRNDRAALESRDDKHCHAAPARSCRRGSFTRRARRQRPVPCRWRRKPSGRQGAAGTRGGAFTRWRIGGGARRDRGDRAAKAIAISERRARRPAARATAREAADGSQMPSMPFRLQGGVEGVRRRPAQRASQTARLCVDIGTTGRMGCVETWALGPLVGLHIGGYVGARCLLARPQARGPRHADPAGIVERQSVADAQSRFRRGLLPGQVSGSSCLVRRRRTRTNDAGRCWKAPEPAAGGRSSAAQ